MEELDLEQTLVVGVSFGAWIAAAMAVKSTARMSRLVLANPVGIKVGDRETRDILDIFAMLEAEFLENAFADPATATRDYRAMGEDELRVVARNRESTARFAWSPYMHDPKLRQRLHRIRIPTLVLWGDRGRARRRRAMAAPLRGHSRCASSSPSKAPAIFRISNSRRRSPSRRSPSPP